MASQAIERKGLAAVGFRSGMSRHAEELVHEVSEGKAVLVLNGAGEAERVLALAVLNLARDDGCVFVQLGTWDGANVSADCQLPAGKRMENESTSDTLHRMLSTKLPALLNCVDLMRVEQQVTKKASKKYGINTKYLRRVCFATLSRTVQAPTCTVAEQYGETCCLHPAAGTSTNSSSQMAVAPPIPERFLHHPTYFFGSMDKGVFYTWLDNTEFKHLSSTSGEDDISAWVQALRPLEVMLPDAAADRYGEEEMSI